MYKVIICYIFICSLFIHNDMHSVPRSDIIASYFQQNLNPMKITQVNCIWTMSVKNDNYEFVYLLLIKLERHSFQAGRSD